MIIKVKQREKQRTKPVWFDSVINSLGMATTIRGAKMVVLKTIPKQIRKDQKIGLNDIKVKEEPERFCVL